jgi:integrase
MPITDTAIRNAKPTDKLQKLFDGGGLFLLVTPSGGKWWRLKYRYASKEKLLSLGTYPEVSLKDARERREEARKQIANGADPSAIKQQTKIDTRINATNTFKAIADEWMLKQAKKNSEATQKRHNLILTNDLMPWLGKRPLKEVKAPELLGAIQRIESRGANELAHRALRLANKIFLYGIVTGKAEYNVAADLRGALEPVVVTHRAAITDPVEVGGLLRAIDGYKGTFTVKCALQLSPMFFTRPGELRNAEWSEFDLEKAEWNIPAEKMKMKVAHLVPLCKQAIAVLNELKPLTGNGKYLFPSVRTSDRPMSNNSVNAALRRLGFGHDDMTAHGFRALARTILDEILGFRPDFIEHQLAHAVRDPNGRAYNRTAHLAERRKMMQAWADYLDKLKTGADIVPIFAGVA